MIGVVLADDQALLRAGLRALLDAEPDITVLGEASDGHGGTLGRVRMRVHERGVGETRSCGTGACAAALAVRTWAGPTAPDTWLVDVPGGTVRVRMLGSGTVELAGPAVLVATAQVDLAALSTE